MINPMKIMQIKGMWDKFTSNHPKFPRFLAAVSTNGIQEGTIIDITITEPNGEKMESNLKISAEDLELFRQLKEIGSQQ